MNTAYTIDPASNPKLEHNIQAFLKGLNSGEGKPLEQLSPTEARDVFVGFQASAPHDLAPADIEHKTVEQGHLSLNLTIVRPIGVKEKAPAFPVLPRRRFHVGGLPDA